MLLKAVSLYSSYRELNVPVVGGGCVVSEAGGYDISFSIYLYI